MIRKLTVWAGEAIALLLAAAPCGADEVFPVIHNETIAVRVLSGKDGQPQSRIHVALTGGYTGRDLGLGLWREEAQTDATGTVQLSNALRNLPLLRVEVLKRHSCAAQGGALSVETIRRDGLSTANRCGPAVARNAHGVLTVFVKGGRDSVQIGPKAAAKQP